MQRTGPDSVRSWLIVFFCSLISMMLYGVVRLSGIMFVASMEKFQVDRQSASLPYILCDFLQAMTGPVTGFLSLKFGARQVMTLGSFIAAVGTGACFFAQNIETVTVLWGIVYGLGFGLSSLLLPAIITQNFVKRRATAISLVYVGSYVGFSFLPSIADLLIHTYGLSGTYLFLSGFLLHCVPLSMLLRPPDIVQTQENIEIKRSRGDSICIVGGYPLCAVRNSMSSLNDETLHDLRIRHSKNAIFKNDSIRSDTQYRTRQSVSSIRLQSHLGQINEGFRTEESTQLDRNHQYSMESFKTVAKFKYIADQEDNIKTTPKLLNFERIESSSNIFLNLEIPYSREAGNNRGNLLKELLSRSINDESLFEHPAKSNDKINTIQDHLQKNKMQNISKQELTISKGMQIFLEPIFLLVLFGNAVYSSSFIAFITVIVDLSIDIGISESDGKFVIMFFSIASNIGLLSFGWVTDCGYLSLTNFAALMLLFRTVTLCMIPFSSGFGMLITIVICQGFAEASLANLFPLMVTEHFIDEIHELAISCTLFLCGPMYLCTPLLIGFFRDGLGSYVYLFLLMATMSLICSILHFIAPVLAKCRCGRDDWILRKSES